MKKTLYLTWLVGALMAYCGNSYAHSNRHWDFAPDGFNIPQGQLMQAQLPKEYKFARLNTPALYQELSDAYRAPADAPPWLISIPNTEGGYSEFYITPTKVVADEVAHLYTAKTFKGYAKNSRQVTLRCGISPTGFHAAVFSGDLAYVVEPASLSDVNAHMVYYKSDLDVPGFRCGVDDTHRRSGYKPSESGSPKTPANLRTYRLAIMHTFIVNSSGLSSGGFDVGHPLLWANTGGVAYLGAVCSNTQKGGGFSGSNGSVTQLYVDYMAHELGHQLGGEHTFASSECGTSEPRALKDSGSLNTSCTATKHIQEKNKQRCAGRGLPYKCL